MRRLPLAAACAAALSLALAAPASAVTEIDITDNFNVDVVMGTTADTTQEALDGGGSDFALVSQTRAETASSGDCGADPDGLPNDGFLAGQGANRPGIELETTAHALDANNAIQLTGTQEDVWDAFLPASGRWAYLILYATGGNGPVGANLTVTYADGQTVVIPGPVPDWFDGVGSGSDDLWELFIDGDRMDVSDGRCENSNATTIFARRFALDPSREIVGLKVARQDWAGDADARLNIFGANLVAAYPLTVTLAGEGGGSVTGSGINCGSDCSHMHIEGRRVSLTASHLSHSTFAGWSGACSGTGFCSVTMDQARSVTARFDKAPQTDPPGENTADAPPPAFPPPPPPLVQPLPQEVEPESVPFRRIASAPALRGCAARKRLRVRIKRVAGVDITSATVLAGDATKTFTPAGRRRAAIFRNVPKAAFTVTVEVATSDGRTLVATKKLRKCRAARRKKRAA